MPRRRVHPRVAFVVRIVIMLVFLGAAVLAAVEHAPAPAAAAGAVAALQAVYVVVIWRFLRRVR